MACLSKIFLASINHGLRFYNEAFNGTQKVESSTEYEYPFCLDGGPITAFDFEACCVVCQRSSCGPLPCDSPHPGREDRSRQGARFWMQLLQGYRTVNALEPAWFPHIPTFLRHREIGRYLKLWRSCNGDVGSLTGLNRDS